MRKSKLNIPLKREGAATVNKRRKEAGFEQTVEENAKRLGIEYQVLTLEEVNKDARVLAFSLLHMLNP